MGEASSGGSTMFQSTHPRGARHTGAHGAGVHLGVSIHAPARGATAVVPAFSRRAGVSIHAPAGRRDCTPRCRPPSSRCFNSRAREGRDMLEALAPAPTGCFNPRARGGATRPRSPVQARTCLFQSTRTRGTRRANLPCANKSPMFQSSRTRGTRLRVSVELHVSACVSIHAPAGRRDRRVHAGLGTVLGVSIHTPAGGARRTLTFLALLALVF